MATATTKLRHLLYRYMFLPHELTYMYVEYIIIFSNIISMFVIRHTTKATTPMVFSSATRNISATRARSCRWNTVCKTSRKLPLVTLNRPVMCPWKKAFGNVNKPGKALFKGWNTSDNSCRESRPSGTRTGRSSGRWSGGWTTSTKPWIVS